MLSTPQNAAPVPGRISLTAGYVRPRCQLLETFEECVEVSIRLSFAVLANATPVDSVEIRLARFAVTPVLAFNLHFLL